MRRLLPILALILSACAGTKGQSEVAPRFDEPTLAGTTRSFDPQALTRPTLFAFWASWCTSCQKEVDILSALYLDKSGKLDIIGVNVDRDLDKARSFAAEKEMRYASVVDAELSVSDLFGVRKTPTFILVSRSGRITYRGDRLDDDFFAAIEAALK